MSNIKPVGYALKQDLLEYKSTMMWEATKVQTLLDMGLLILTPLYTQDQVNAMLKEVGDE